MGRQRKLRQAPITEAVIDLRLVDGVSIAARDQDRLHDAVGRDKFPRVTVRQDLVAEFQPERLEAQRVDSSLAGFHFCNDNEVVQFRANGFTFSRLEPYTEWGRVVGDAMRLWSVYLDELGPVESVSRVAVRYINIMGFKHGEIDLVDVFEEPLRGPDGVPPEVVQFELKTLHRVTENRAVIIAQGMQPTDEGFAIRLDIDAFEANTYRCDAEGLLSALGELRELKNSVFFNTLTDKVIGRYE